jgi:hypothetical protein
MAKPRVAVVGLALVVALLAVQPGPQPSQAAGGLTVSFLEPGKELVDGVSMMLDASGNPVISYVFSDSPAVIRVARCNDPGCLGGDEVINTIFTFQSNPYNSSLTTVVALDALDRPVVAFSDPSQPLLKVIHCNDNYCADSDEIIGGLASGVPVSMQLDGAGNPMLAYRDYFGLKYVHCNDSSCAGSDDSPVLIEASQPFGYLQFPSLVLDSSGNPVMSYSSASDARVKLIHCDDPGCSSGGESTETISPAAGLGSSVTLDGAGNPLVSYLTGFDSVMLAHCDDPNCSPGGDSNIQVHTASFNSQSFTDLHLSPSGNPIMTYGDSAQDVLPYLRCDDPDCSGSNELVIERLYERKVSCAVSHLMDVDNQGNPTIAYLSTMGGIKVLHCSDTSCGAASAPVPAGSNVRVVLGSGVTASFDEVPTAGTATLVVAKGPPLGLSSPLYYSIGTSPNYIFDEAAVCIEYDGAAYSAAQEESLRMASWALSYGAHWIDMTTSLDIGIDRICGQFSDSRLGPFAIVPLLPDQDDDGDGCTNGAEMTTFWTPGGFRDPFNHFDYFNPSGDGLNRIDDVLMTVDQYYKDDSPISPGLPPYAPGYNPDTDRTPFQPNPWNLGTPNGLQRVDDILHQLQQYGHDCA